ncbi:hypothetical protein INT46_007088 [Mucor plumbeus]|uniref:FAD dependent oxidoreductase domain-containing protein n=1 Tax=Mucor plumbeus TaxID=97098 RepID=A0A8H7RUF8_9FUNG|nr:hypothetical protein INT46_007088 [Mucor plumbeus]
MVCNNCTLGKVTVIGAGVVGLTTALLLQQRGYDVTIVADHFPGDKSIEYTSPVAGARWKTLAPNSDLRLQRYDAVSFNIFWELAKTHAAEAGIMVVSAYDYHEKCDENVLNPWWKTLVPTFQTIDKKELPDQISVGYHYTTVLINPLVYLPWLLKQYFALGGKHRKQKIDQISDVISDDTDIVVNCTGVRAKDLGGVMDKSITPTRGQNVIIRAPHIRKTISMSRPDSYTYVIPRCDGTVILGTTKDTNSTDHNINKNTTADILKRAIECCPDLSLSYKGIADLKVVGNVVGIRPTRKGGPRVQNEYFKLQSGKQVLITHNYGHGGSGFQSSWGTAQEAVRLIKQGNNALRNDTKNIRKLLSRL